jgi:hypothetical protein
LNVFFRVRGNEQVEAMLKELPKGTKRIAVLAVADYIKGDKTHGLTYYPPVQTQKYVRTFTLQKGWVIAGDEYRPVIKNFTPYVDFVPRWKQYGWREWAVVVKDNLQGALRHANALVKSYLAKYK